MALIEGNPDNQNPLTAELAKDALRTQRLVLHLFNFALFAHILPTGALAKAGFEFFAVKKFPILS